MMIGFLSEQRHAAHKAESFDEIVEFPAFLDSVSNMNPAIEAANPGGDFNFIKLADHLALAFRRRCAYREWMQTMPPSLDDIENLARQAIARLPLQFRSHLDGVVLRIDDFPDTDVTAEMECESEWELLGLYSGRHVGMKGDVPTGAMPDMIFLYRQPLLAEWCVGDNSLETLVTHVLVHEVGHHFGLSDDDIDAIEISVD